MSKEQTELEEIKDVIAEHILTKGEQVYISDAGEEKLKHILEQAITSYAEVRVKEERERIVKLIDKCYPKYTHFDCTSSDCIECKEYKVADEALSKLLALTNKEEE